MGNRVKPKIVVCGVMGQSPFAGVAWQVLHYIEGLRRLSFDVVYLEDTGEWPYDPDKNAVTSSGAYAARHLTRLMEWIGLPSWAYRNAGDQERVVGPLASTFSRTIEEADALINLTGSTVMRDEHLKIPVRIYLETDPVLPQVEIASGRQRTIELLDAHTHHFTYGENFGTEDCLVPLGRYEYQATRQPIVLDWWPVASDPQRFIEAPFTTVASWRQSHKDIAWQGEKYTWSKETEFIKFLELPRKLPDRFELALAQIDETTRSHLFSNGWSVVDAVGLSLDIGRYREYLTSSKGEFTVAKDQNVRLRSGWFSDRSACYLACGKPVVTQDTGFGNILPIGQGLFAFKTFDDIVAAVAEINSDYLKHATAARDIAETYFASERVLGEMMGRTGLA